MKKFLLNIARPIKNIAYSFAFSIYDYCRYAIYSGMMNRSKARRDFQLIKMYHTIEKSLAFRTQKENAGKSMATNLRLYLDKNRHGCSTLSEKTAADVLQQYMERNNMEATIKRDNKKSLGGALPYTARQLQQGVLEHPESFFLSRYTIRDFNDFVIDKQIIIRALDLANKTPSSCNRQPWYTYHIDNKELIRNILNIQNGARGFAHQISCLLIVTIDVRAYDTAVERYQGWIDGGMYGMSVIYALHSLGIGTCCLNWAKSIKDDMKLRRIIPIHKEHNALMMISAGIPKEELKVCRSTRAPVSSKYQYVRYKDVRTKH